MDDPEKQSPAPPAGTLPTAYEGQPKVASSGRGLLGAMLDGALLGKYRVGRQLGAGGMGAVFEATHTEIGKAVAVKILNTQLAADPKAHERFRREATNLSRLVHPNIVNVTDFGDHEGTPYLVMELLRGEDLADHIERNRRGLPIANAVDIVLPVAAAIFAAHEAGIIHRDLKPRNIFLANNSVNEIQPKVLDFGISRLRSEAPGSSLTDSGALLGTVPYLPPEHVRGGQCDERSDQYTLGVVLFECLTGRQPHDGPTPMLIMQEIMAGRFLRPAAFRPDLPPQLEQILLRATSFAAADRFTSVFEFGRALLPFASPRERVIWAKYFTGVDATLPPGEAPSPPPGAPVFTAPIPPSHALVPQAPTHQLQFGVPSGAVNQWYWQSATNERAPSFPTTERVPPNRPRRTFMRLVGGLGALGVLGVVASKRWGGALAPPISPAREVREEAVGKAPAVVNPSPTIAPPARSSAIRATKSETTLAPTGAPEGSPEVTIELIGAPADAIAKLDGFPATLPLRLPRENRSRELTIWAPGFETVTERVIPTENRRIDVVLKALSGRAESSASPAPVAPNPATPAMVNVAVRSRPARAEVWIEGEASSRGRTPMLLKLPKSSRPTRITLRLAGFQPNAPLVVPTANHTVDVELRRVSKQRPSPAAEDAGNLQLLRIDD